MSIITNQTLYLCATNDKETCDNTWQGKLVIFTSKNPPHIDNILKTTSAFPTDIHFEIHMAGFTNNAYLYFMNNGELNNNGHFSFSIGSNELDFTLSKTGIVKPAS